MVRKNPKSKYKLCQYNYYRRREPEAYEESSQNSSLAESGRRNYSNKENQTWELVSRLREVKLISCNWVYKLKRRPNESILRYKARTMAPRFSQQYGLDNDEIFSPVMKITIV